MSEVQPIEPGHVSVASNNLRGQQLAWAACQLFDVPAMIVGEEVMTQGDDGAWYPFDCEAMLAAVIAKHTETAAIPFALVPA